MERLINELINELQSHRFYTMVLHHILAIGLVLISHIMWFHTIGTVVMIFHDINDVFLSMARLAWSFNNEFIANIAFIFLAISWICTRVYGYFYEVVIPIIFIRITNELQSGSFFIGYIFQVTSLCMLGVMNLFWTW